MVYYIILLVIVSDIYRPRITIDAIRGMKRMVHICDMEQGEEREKVSFCMLRSLRR